MTFTSMSFIGGGNMASAIISGLLRQGQACSSITVVEPTPEQAERLRASLGVHTLAAPVASLRDSPLVVWAVKPQQFLSAAPAYRELTAGALHFSVMAGLRVADIARALGTERIVRSMPNTPALIGKGMVGLYAPASITAPERSAIARLVEPMGAQMWLDQEIDLDSVTALSGSGPAYVFYFLEAMQEAATQMGLSAAQGRALALATFSGASELAAQAPETFAALREKVTSKGGTTAAALAQLQSSEVSRHFVAAMLAARQRARELGDEFGA